MTAFITAGAGFLLAVLWFDLMFDLQARRRSGEEEVPGPALDSIAAYYGRVTTGARPMNRLIAVVMLATVIAIVIQLGRDEVPSWVSVASLALAGFGIGLAASLTVPRATRLGERRDPREVQGRLARLILRDHLLCLAAIAALLVLQLTHLS
jgi:hypothetical protein